MSRTRGATEAKSTPGVCRWLHCFRSRAHRRHSRRPSVRLKHKSPDFISAIGSCQRQTDSFPPRPPARRGRLPFAGTSLRALSPALRAFGAFSDGVGVLGGNEDGGGIVAVRPPHASAESSRHSSGWVSPPSLNFFGKAKPSRQSQSAQALSKPAPCRHAAGGTSLTSAGGETPLPGCSCSHRE